MKPTDNEIREKERRIRELMREKGLSAILFKRQANFSWLTGGGLNLVGITMETGVASLLVTEKEKFVLTNDIEAPRMMEEEKLGEQGFILHSYPWHEEREAALVGELKGTGAVGCDVAYPQTVLVTEDIARLRYSLTPEEGERYRWLGLAASLALEETMMTARPGEKESEVVGRLLQRLWSDRIDAITLMSAADERIARFRHPIPTEKRVEKFLMVSVNARKGGLIVSFTRFVHFGKVPADLKDKYLANVMIDCAFMAHTRPGVPAREVFLKGLEAYRKAGYPEEWRFHHQGGSIGYQGRDYRANFHTPDLVQENQAFTWNPSLAGTKSEDTILARADGPEMITKPIIYPTVGIEAAGLSFVRPDILEK